MKFDSKRIFWILLNLILAVGIVVFLIVGKALWSYGKSVSPSRVIEITAEGKVTVSPDVANLSFSVVSEGTDPIKIQNENNTKINDSIDFVKQNGVDVKDIKTANYNLSPRYEYDQTRRKSFISGYTLTQSVLVKIRDLNKTAPILGGLPSKGINQIESLSFDIDNPDNFLNQARQEAFSKARMKAEVMARQNGVSIGKVVTFRESAGYPSPIPYLAGFSKGVVPGAPVLPAIQPGSQEVKVQVNVTYEIE